MEFLNRKAAQKEQNISELSEPEWRQLSDEWERSEESQSDFCKRKNIRYSTFVYWRSQLKQTDKSSRQLARIQVKPSESVKSSIPMMLKLQLPSGIQVSIPDGMGPCTIKNVLDLIGATRC